MTLKGKHVFGLAAGIALLSGCGGVSPDDRYESADELREALDSEGFRCSVANSFEIFEGYGDEVRCNSGMSIVVWDEDMPEYADDISLLRLGASVGGGEILESHNWLILHDNGPMLNEIQNIFGGER